MNGWMDKLTGNALRGRERPTLRYFVVKLVDWAGRGGEPAATLLGEGSTP